MRATLASLVVLLAVAPLSAGERTPGDIYQQTLQSTAWIHTAKRQGTGWLADAKNRLVITNYHVVGPDESATVVFPDFRDGKLIAESRYYRENEAGLQKSGRAVSGKVIATDPKSDLAIIRLDSLPDGVTALRLASGSPGPSDRIHSIGNPGASDAFWVYASGTVRQVYHNKFQYEDGQVVEAQVIETQVPLNRGDSGGPVVNDFGELVGVNAAGKAGAQLVSLSIDVSEVKSFLASASKPEPADAKSAGRSGEVSLLPRNPTAADHNNRGVEFYANEQYDRAIGEYDRALRLNPRYSLAYRNRAIAFLKIGTLMGGRGRQWYALALADYGAVLSLDPGDAEAYRDRGIVYTKMGDQEKAIADFNKAIEINPKDADVYRRRSRAYRDKGDLDKAATDIEKAVAAERH